jgi:hypothetical protein
MKNEISKLREGARPAVDVIAEDVLSIIREKKRAGSEN